MQPGIPFKSCWAWEIYSGCFQCRGVAEPRHFGMQGGILLQVSPKPRQGMHPRMRLTRLAASSVSENQKGPALDVYACGCCRIGARACMAHSSCHMSCAATRVLCVACYMQQISAAASQWYPVLLALMRSPSTFCQLLTMMHRRLPCSAPQVSCVCNRLSSAR